MSFRFSGVIVESASSGGVVPSRNKQVSFVDMDGVPVVFDGGVSVVTTDMNGRFGPLTHPTLTQIRPVVDGRTGDDVISASVDVGKLSQQTQAASDAAVQAAADAQSAQALAADVAARPDDYLRTAANEIARGNSHVSLDDDGTPFVDLDNPGTQVLFADTDGVPYWI